MSPRRSLATTARIANQYDELIQPMFVRFGHEVGRWPNAVPKRDEELHDDRDRIGLGVWLNRADDLAQKSVVRLVCERVGPGNRWRNPWVGRSALGPVGGGAE